MSKIASEAGLGKAIDLLVEVYGAAQDADDVLYRPEDGAAPKATRKRLADEAWCRYQGNVELVADLFGLPAVAVAQIVEIQAAEQVYPGLAFGMMPPDSRGENL